MISTTVKKIGLGLAIMLLGTSVAQAAEENKNKNSFPGEFSANVSFVSEYYFRGISQNDDAPALQGGFDYSLPLGKDGTSFYAGVWGSSVDFNENASSDGASLEEIGRAHV